MRFVEVVYILVALFPALFAFFSGFRFVRIIEFYYQGCQSSKKGESWLHEPEANNLSFAPLFLLIFFIFCVGFSDQLGKSSFGFFFLIFLWGSFFGSLKIYIRYFLRYRKNEKAL